MYPSQKNFAKIIFLTVCTVNFFLFVDFVTAQSASETVTVTAVVPGAVTTSVPIPSSTPSGGGGGGGAVGFLPSSQHDSVVFKGLAYPGSIVSLLQNGKIVTELPASPDGTFEIHLKNLTAGTYSFGIRAEDSERRKSTLDVYTVFISSGVTTMVEGLFIPPTITTDKIEVRRGDPITIMGRSAPNANVTLSIHSPVEIIKRIKASSAGNYIYKLDSQELDYGEHESKARSITEDELSLYSDVMTFKVGDVNRARTSGAQSKLGKCDLNNDNRVNILDFSIIAFWYKRTGFPMKVDLNSDNKVDLGDVSIIAYCWTG